VYDLAGEFSLTGGVSSRLADDHHGQQDVWHAWSEPTKATCGTRLDRWSVNTSCSPPGAR